eukprot:NODE_1954_length_715_cov_140.752252_g1646_i0.p1 GENE.NODE_1954_length_715_cov_140.752252_g1646_i0~~NODE_1954_length_715_cov_140.752252_g1646_i0.p1  ORF type:complete len:158 (-),score=0.30 NODE_1954_length_715_cov_140.752252_g1646_i0:165-638(-)
MPLKCNTCGIVNKAFPNVTWDKSIYCEKCLTITAHTGFQPGNEPARVRSPRTLSPRNVSPRRTVSPGRGGSSILATGGGDRVVYGLDHLPRNMGAGGVMERKHDNRAIGAHQCMTCGTFNRGTSDNCTFDKAIFCKKCLKTVPHKYLSPKQLPPSYN